MKLVLTPQYRPGPLSVAVEGDVLTIDGVVLDFSPVPEGGELPLGSIDCELINGPVTREDGTLIVPLVLPRGRNAPPETLAPTPITVTQDGPVALPPYETEEDEA